MLTQQTLEAFLDQLASGSATPGGGSAAALLGAIGASLVSMVCHLTLGKEKYKEVSTEIGEVLGQSEALRKELTRLIQADADAFNRVSSAYRMPRTTEEQKSVRSAAIQEALVFATEIPLETARASSSLLPLCRKVAEIGNEQAVSDAGVAALAAEASLRSAFLNIEINLASITDQAFVARVREEMKTLDQQRAGQVEAILQIVAERL